MAQKITKIVWTRQAREALNEILDYRYKEVPSARKIVRKDIISSSKQITFPKQYQSDLLSAAFSSNLEEFIKKYTNKIDVWAHGHTHHSVNYQIADTRIISNQRGYSSIEKFNFDCGYIVEI